MSLVINKKTLTNNVKAIFSPFKSLIIVDFFLVKVREKNYLS